MKGRRDIYIGFYMIELITDNIIMETKNHNKLFANNIYECMAKVNMV